jgi:hypothetical protein
VGGHSALPKPREERWRGGEIGKIKSKIKSNQIENKETLGQMNRVYVY